MSLSQESHSIKNCSYVLPGQVAAGYSGGDGSGIVSVCEYDLMPRFAPDPAQTGSRGKPPEDASGQDAVHILKASEW